MVDLRALTKKMGEPVDFCMGTASSTESTRVNPEPSARQNWPPPLVELYQRTRAHTWRALGLLGVRDHAEREDLLQDVYLAVLTGYHRYDPQRGHGDHELRLQCWIYGIARNMVKKSRNKSRIHREVLSSYPSGEVTHNTPEARTAALDVAKRCVGMLDVDHRAVLVMHDVEGYPMPEIARGLGISEPLGYKRLSAARSAVDAAAQRLGLHPRRAAAGAPIALLALLADSETDMPDDVAERVLDRLHRVQSAAEVAARTAGSPGALARLSNLAAQPTFALVGASLVTGLVAVTAIAIAGVPPRASETVPSLAMGPDTASPLSEPPPPAIAPAEGVLHDRSVAIVEPPPQATNAPTISAPNVEELSLLQQARSAYTCGDFDGAKNALDLHGERYPWSSLAADREALRAQVTARSALKAPAEDEP